MKKSKDKSEPLAVVERHAGGYTAYVPVLLGVMLFAFLLMLEPGQPRTGGLNGLPRGLFAVPGAVFVLYAWVRAMPVSLGRVRLEIHDNGVRMYARGRLAGLLPFEAISSVKTEFARSRREGQYTEFGVTVTLRKPLDPEAWWGRSLLGAKKAVGETVYFGEDWFSQEVPIREAIRDGLARYRGEVLEELTDEVGAAEPPPRPKAGGKNPFDFN